MKAVVLISLVVAAPAFTQVQQQAKTLTIPSFTTDENWQRATSLMYAYAVGGYAVAKLQGVSPEDYGHKSAEVFAWSGAAGSPIGYARTMANNFRALRGGGTELLSVSDTSVTFRVKRAWVPYFGATKTAHGVTLDEYEAVNKAFSEGSAKRLGLRYEQRIDSAYVVMTVSGMGNSPLRPFPQGQYATTLSATEVPANPALVGSWTLDFAQNARYTLRKNDGVFVTTKYDVAYDEIVFRDEKVADGSAGCPGPGKYRWSVNPANANLSLNKLSDDCAQRVAFLTRRAFSKR